MSDRKDKTLLEEQIRSKVYSVLQSIDLDYLKKDINDKAETTYQQVKDKFDTYSDKYFKTKDVKKRFDINLYINKKPAGRVSSVLYLIFGGIGLGLFGLLFVVALSMNLFFVTRFLDVSVLLLAGFCTASVCALSRGMTLQKRLTRFKNYIRLMNNNTHLLIEDIAKLTRKKKSFVVKDLNKMIKLGMFLQAHVDDEENYFIINDEVYTYYLGTKKQKIDEEKYAQQVKNNSSQEAQTTQQSKNTQQSKGTQQDKVAQRDKATQENNKTQASTGTTPNLLSEARKDVQTIEHLNNQIDHEVMTQQLNQLIKSSYQIIEQVEKNPEKIQDINKFIQYYLPSVIKLMTLYTEISNQTIQGSNIEQAKYEIETSIHMINEAFEQLADDLFEDIAMDVSSDISVLKTLFKQEGLTEKDFEK